LTAEDPLLIGVISLKKAGRRKRKRFLSAQTDCFTGAKREEKVGSLHSKWEVGWARVALRILDQELVVEFSREALDASPRITQKKGWASKRYFAAEGGCKMQAEIVRTSERWLVGRDVAVAVFVAVTIGAEVVGVPGLLVVAAVAAILTIVTAVLQTLVEVIHHSGGIFLLAGRDIAIAVFVAVAIGVEVVRIPGLLVIAAVAAILTIVAAVLQTLLKGPSCSALIVVTVLVLKAMLILVLLRGNSGTKSSRAKTGEGDSQCQHP
jgi:hypothetical protein